MFTFEASGNTAFFKLNHDQSAFRGRCLFGGGGVIQLLTCGCSYLSGLTLRASLIAQLVKNPPAIQETEVGFLGWEDPLDKGQVSTPIFLGVPCGSAGKESACNAGDLDLIPGLGRSPEEGKSYPLQCSGLENCMDCIVHGFAESDMTEPLSLSLRQ